MFKNINATLYTVLYLKLALHSPAALPKLLGKSVCPLYRIPVPDTFNHQRYVVC